MKEFKKILRVTFSALGMLSGLSMANAQQNVQFSQYVFNGLAVNPAYAGYKENWYGHATYRKQWVGFDGAPETTTLSADGLTKNPNKKVGLGLMVIQDQLGPQESLSVMGNYAYRLQLDGFDTRRLSFGLGFGFTQYKIDGNVLRYKEEGDQSIPVGEASTVVPNLHAGIYYYAPRWYLGFSVMDLLADLDQINWTYQVNNVQFSDLRKSRHLYLTGGLLFDLSEKVKLKPTFMLKEDFRGPTNLDLNAFVLLNERLWLGASWRTGIGIWSKDNLQSNLSRADAASAIVEFYINERIRIGYSFDYTISDLANYENGSHEISLGITFPRKEERVLSPRYF